jgi:hypothetical protein
MRMRTGSWITVVMIAIAAAAAAAKPKAAKVATPPAKGFWKVLVQPNAKWTLYKFGEVAPKASDEPSEPITIETYDVRKVGDADVARLRWRHGADATQSALAGTNAPRLDQVAVTAAGLYLLTADMDDAKVAEALHGKPSRSDPPRPYKGTKLNQGRYLEVRDDLVCLGQGPAPGDPPCEDTCDGSVCISATDGIVRLEGNWAPSMAEYVQVKAPARK